MVSQLGHQGSSATGLAVSLQFATGPSSTAFAIDTLARALESAAEAALLHHDGQLAERLRSLSGSMGKPEAWRDNYQRIFAELSAFEFNSADASLQRELLHATSQHIIDPSGASLEQLISRESLARAAGSVLTVEVRGSGPVSPLATIGRPTAEGMIEHRLAEPGIRASLGAYDDRVASHPNAPVNGELLVAVGANAELSLAQDWLAIGGSVVAVARAKPEKWMSMIAAARASAGVLRVPVLATRAAGVDLTNLTDEQLAQLAGLDLQDDLAAIAAWVLAEAKASPADRVVLLGSVYAPGKNQILASAAQDAVMAAASRELDRNRLVLGWLATPLEVVVRDAKQLDQLLEDYKKLPVAQRIRAMFWQLFGGLKKPVAVKLRYAELPPEFAVFDYSAQRQGSSYLFAKRIERWRADVANRSGIRTWYQIAPPAQTDSTLSYKVVRAAFRGLAKLGSVAFEAWMLRDLLTAILIGDLKAEITKDALADSAIHGGVWRLPYDPQTVWKPAAGMGWRELLR